MANKLIKRLCIIGVGLIGGSLARALRQAEAVHEIVGVGRNKGRLEKAKDLGVIDAYSMDLEVAVHNADMVVMAVPVGSMEQIFKAIKPYMNERITVTDVGSTKGSVVHAAQQVFGQLSTNFVPGHPIAGTEKSGVEASIAELFQGHRVVLTPDPSTRTECTTKVRNMWKTCGAEVVEFSVEHHDDVLAATSHLPHMLAYALVDALAQGDDSREIFDFAAGGFKDFTRIASSDPVMWHDICLANQRSLVTVLRRFNTDLQRLAQAIQEGDSDFILQLFKHAKQARDEFCDR